MFFPPKEIDNVYIVFQLSHAHLEVPVTSNIEITSKSIGESRASGIGKMIVPLSEIKYFIQAQKGICVMKFKDGEKLEILGDIEEIIEVLHQSKIVGRSRQQ
jgi:hypothetical protein